MQRSFKLIYLTLLLLLCVPFGALAQTSSINAYSPYSMYGPGELLTPGNAQMRAMGGVGLGKRTVGQINTINPAAASSIARKSFLFDVGIDGTHFRNSQPKYDQSGKRVSTSKTGYNTANIHNIAIAFPLAKSLGASLSVAPYSSVGYKINTTDQNESNWADIGRVQYGYEGMGDITEVKLSIGWMPWRKFSIGVAAKYYWGYIERKYQTSVTDQIIGTEKYSSTVCTDEYLVNSFKFQVGVQWSPISTDSQILTFGATYDLGGALNPEVRNIVSTGSNINSSNNKAREDISTLSLRVPHQVGAGLFYRNRTIAFGADYVYAAWGNDNTSFSENHDAQSVNVTYTNTHTVKLGFEITPRSSDVRNYLNRMSYRVGARAGNYYQSFGGECINQFAITAGIGLPVKVWGASSVNIGFEYGHTAAPKRITVGSKSVGLVSQNYYKISIGFSLFSGDTSDYWFVRQKFD
ncbi:MAG: hypothetical protein J6Q95_01695 [Alistipes sp.]|nr:hypothetical protein [Alistipes sp.]